MGGYSFFGSAAAAGGGLDGQDVEVLTWDAATQNLDWATSAVKDILLSTDVDTQGFLNTPPDGEFGEMHFRVLQDGTGGHGIAFHASIDWVNGEPDVAGMGPNQEAFFTLQVSDGGTSVKGSSTVPSRIRYLTGNHTLQLSDIGKELRFASASDVTLTIPAFASTAFPKGPICVIHQRDAGAVIISAPSTLYGKGDRTNGAGSGAGLSYEGTDVWWLSGDVTSP